MSGNLTQSRRTWRRLTIAWTALTLSLDACSVAGRGPYMRQSEAAGVVPKGGIAVYVTNDHDEDVRVFVLRGTIRIPIGTVGNFSARRLVVSPAELGSSGTLILAAQAFGSQRIAAPQALDITPGTEVEFRIGSRLAYTTLVPRTHRLR